MSESDPLRTISLKLHLKNTFKDGNLTNLHGKWCRDTLVHQPRAWCKPMFCTVVRRQTAEVGVQLHWSFTPDSQVQGRTSVRRPRNHSLSLWRCRMIAWEHWTHLFWCSSLSAAFFGTWQSPVHISKSFNGVVPQITKASLRETTSLQPEGTNMDMMDEP